jgi:hypothetical protein
MEWRGDWDEELFEVKGIGMSFEFREVDLARLVLWVGTPGRGFISVKRMQGFMWLSYGGTRSTLYTELMLDWRSDISNYTLRLAG